MLRQCRCVDKGELFGWGNNEYDQLITPAEHDDQMQVSTPRHLPLAGVGRVVKATAAGAMCAVINGNMLQHLIARHFG